MKTVSGPLTANDLYGDVRPPARAVHEIWTSVCAQRKLSHLGFVPGEHWVQVRVQQGDEGQKYDKNKNTTTLSHTHFITEAKKKEVSVKDWWGWVESINQPED